jgi:hypothetical protein
MIRMVAASITSAIAVQARLTAGRRRPGGGASTSGRGGMTRGAGLAAAAGVGGLGGDPHGPVGTGASPGGG